jgi:iron complex outermembrane receptor protein
VVVTATRFSENANTLPMGVSVINADDIHNSGVTTINEALMRLLGVPGRMDLYGASNYSLDLRGFGETSVSNQVVVLDGVRLNEADLSAPQLAGIPIEAVERIEVLRGNGAVLYGEGATGGVIVITTKAGSGTERRNKANIYTGFGTNNLRDTRVNATFVSGGFSLDASGQKRDTDNYRQNSRSESDGGNLVAQWSNDMLRLGARHSEDSLYSRLPGSLTAAQFAADPTQSSTPNDWARIKNNRDVVFAELMLSDWQLLADVGWREKHLQSEWSGYAYGYDVNSSDYGLRARQEKRIGDIRNVLVLGHDYGHWIRTSNSLVDADQKTRAWYVKDEVTLATKTSLSAGWRTERIEKTASGGANQLADRFQAWDVGVSQPLTASTHAWVRAGSSFRLANVDEFSFTNPNVTIRPQASRDLEAGLRWAQGAYKLEARLYRSLLTDEIGYDPASGPYGANVNFDPTRRQGVEVDVDWAVQRNLNLAARLGLRRSSFRSGPYAGNEVPLAPSQTLALRADWTPLVGHRVSGGLTMVGTQHSDFANACRMPSYTTADLRYAYQWGKAELSIGLNNAFDRKYYTQAYGCSGGVTTSIYPEAGRTFTTALRVAF